MDVEAKFQDLEKAGKQYGDLNRILIKTKLYIIMKTIENFKSESLRFEKMSKVKAGKIPVESHAESTYIDDNGCCVNYSYNDTFFDTNGDGEWGCNESGSESHSYVPMDLEDCI